VAKKPLLAKNEDRLKREDTRDGESSWHSMLEKQQRRGTRNHKKKGAGKETARGTVFCKSLKVPMPGPTKVEEEKAPVGKKTELGGRSVLHNLRPAKTRSGMGEKSYARRIGWKMEWPI